jgi:YHS domain-containing protein
MNPEPKAKTERQHPEGVSSDRHEHPDLLILVEKGIQGIARITEHEDQACLEEAGICGAAHTRSPADTMDGDNVDPVCKMVVHTSGNPISVTLDRRRHFSCSRCCRRRFVQEQRAAVRASGQPERQVVAADRGARRC